MGCTDGKFRLYDGAWQKCIGGQWVDMPMPPPESGTSVSVRREVTDLAQLASDPDLREAIESEDRRVVIAIEQVEPTDG